MEEKEPVISFEGADIAGGDNIVIYGLDMKVCPGDFIYIVGKVGTGKTSIIRTIIAENRLAKGKGTVCGYDLGSIREKEIPYLRRKLGVVFQDFQLLMDRSVEDNLSFVLKATGWNDGKEIYGRIEEVLNAVGMKNKAHKMPHQLSGGEQQRVAIARALLNRPQVIIADEPTGNLDPETADGIMRLLTRINREKGTAIVMVTHNISLVHRYPGRIMVCGNEECVEKKLAPAPSAKTQDTAPQPDENALTENTVPVPENTAGGGEERIPDSTAKPENKEIQYGENGEDAEAKNGEGGGQENGEDRERKNDENGGQENGQ